MFSEIFEQAGPLITVGLRLRTKEQKLLRPEIVAPCTSLLADTESLTPSAPFTTLFKPKPADGGNGSHKPKIPKLDRIASG